MSPSNTISRRPRPTSVPSGILMHPAVWPRIEMGRHLGGGLRPLFEEGRDGSPSNTGTIRRKLTSR